MATVPAQSEALSKDELAKRFERLAATWRAETAYVSSSTDMFAHPAYQEIIRMGLPVVPLLLADLESEPEHWARALHVITGDNPVPVASKSPCAIMQLLPSGVDNGGCVYGGNNALPA